MMRIPIKAILLFISFSLLSCTPQVDEERQWSSYRGYYSTGYLDDTNIPDTWDVESGENIKWTL